MTTAKHFLLEVSNIQGMKTIKCKKKMVAQPQPCYQRKKSGSLAATKKNSQLVWLLTKYLKSDSIHA